jgi:cyclic pyranopterin phosphate synthase
MTVSKNPQEQAPPASSSLTHVSDSGEARMVDVGSKQITRRTACATSKVTLSVEAAHAVRSDTLKKGDCIAVARIAAIQAAKQTSLLIPLCHVLLIDSVEISYEWTSSTELTWKAVVKATGKTGVEMEALTAVSVAALTVYDMCKAVDQAIVISDIMLLEKSGGANGSYLRSK